MNDTQLQQANDLKSKMKKVAETLLFWQSATALNYGQINVHYEYKNFTEQCPDGYWIRNNQQLNTSPETFLVVKALNVDYWQRELDRLQKEYDAL